MEIKKMFKDDIDRKINGVIQVQQDQSAVIEQEVKEYVVTSELKKHFNKFFAEYADSFEEETNNVGVWITGFFGSGKSHFLKMLSYLLENKEIDGKKTVDYFRKKFDDELSFMDVEKCVREQTETILFNIDVESPSTKDDSVVLRVFAKMFYNHLGLYGSDLKLARLERYIEKKGLWEEFKQAYEAITESDWLKTRQEYNFFASDVIDALVQAGVMNESDAEHWIYSAEEAELSIAQLVEEIKAYGETKPKDFRLLFMVDEVGQYIGTNRSMLLNLQTLIEELGSVCRGKVWIVATGQEALDEMIKVRQDEFSRIMARFAIRLSLTSSSVDEVIEKRLLTKTDQATQTLEEVYECNENVLKNLYAFDTEVKDLKGYSSEREFVNVFPFVPYQFTIMQKVFNEIRMHGHAGKHQSQGERSMLNGFQESARNIEHKNEYALVPMYAFYDTLHSFLDTSVRSVIERAERAANNDEGLTIEDTKLLKLLYLVRYIDDIQSNIENLTILMADSITVDKLVLREKVTASLNRLQKQNYIGRNGDVYQFLTYEEQDIAREINNQVVDSASVISKIAKLIFDDIYPLRKFRYTKGNYQNDFEINKSVDGQNHGNAVNGEMRLRFITEANDDASDLKLMVESKNYEAICRLRDEYSIFNDIENSLKIEKFIRQKNVNQLPESVQKIITNKQKEAQRLSNVAKENLQNAILHGQFFIDGQIETISGTSVKVVLDRALTLLVESTYNSITDIDHPLTSDVDLRNILKDSGEGLVRNEAACDQVYRYLQQQKMLKRTISMSDLSNRYQKKPYGWKEIDVVGVILQLMVGQKIEIKRNGQLVQFNDVNLLGYLQNRTETKSIQVSLREMIPTNKINTVVSFLKEYFGVMDVPNNEDDLVRFIVQLFEEEKKKLLKMKEQDRDENYPGNREIKNAESLIQEVLLARNDHFALVNRICDLENDLLDSKEDMEDVNTFYANQVVLFKQALEERRKVMQDEKDFLYPIPEVKEAVNAIAAITKISNQFDYGEIPKLNGYISLIRDERNKVLEEKKKELFDLIDICETELKAATNKDPKLHSILEDGKAQFDQLRQEVSKIVNLLLIETKRARITSVNDAIHNKIEKAENEENETNSPITKKPVIKKNRKNLQRTVIFNQATLTSEEDIDRYLAQVKNKLLSYLNDGDELSIK
ncbi:BREX system P-loop protein BrxC [Dubosiella newyorkensis]|uniref:BREX system P-loop protein BrxC n=1 Tax=Dubosiella newyorkensis TaxID=1862672 RepID=UPI002731F1C3|nr:BREX system P-loop protein BrxC [Dubosiella newyorkensis]